MGLVVPNGSNVIMLSYALQKANASAITWDPLSPTDTMRLCCPMLCIRPKQVQSHWTRCAQRVQCDYAVLCVTVGIGKCNNMGPVVPNGSNVIMLSYALHEAKASAI